MSAFIPAFTVNYHKADISIGDAICENQANIFFCDLLFVHPKSKEH